jgi:FdhD protein
MGIDKSDGTSALREIEMPVRRWKEGAGIEVVTDRLVAEHTLELAIGDVVLVRLQCLPADLEDLAVGFLLAEGLVEDPKTIAGASLSADGSRVDVDVPGADLDDITRRVGEMTLASGCGRAVFAAEVRRRATEEPARARSAAEILAAVKDLEKRGEIFKSTGCVHGASAWLDGKMLAFREDIGRHNAVDKVAGSVARSGGSLRGALLASTGRLSAEVVAKAVRLGAWGVASRSAPTARAVELAAEFGMVLAGFARGRRLNLYCGAERLAPDAAPGGET